MISSRFTKPSKPERNLKPFDPAGGQRGSQDGKQDVPLPAESIPRLMREPTVLAVLLLLLLSPSSRRVHEGPSRRLLPVCTECSTQSEPTRYSGDTRASSVPGREAPQHTKRGRSEGDGTTFDILVCRTPVLSVCAVSRAGLGVRRGTVFFLFSVFPDGGEGG